MEFKNQQVFTGYNSYLNIEKILKENKVKRPLLVCDGAYDFLFIKDYISNLKYNFVLFSNFTPNPRYEDIKSGVTLFNENNCDFIVSIGGGSAIDVAKCIKLYCKMNSDELYLNQEYKDTNILHLAIPTTAGTGSESTRYAVCYYEGEKQSVTHESIIPDYAILEPEFLKTLPLYQKKATLLDALCQGIESLWSVNSTDESIEYATSAIKGILANLDAYLNEDIEAQERIMLAANLAGKAINITQTTAAHAMSYKITSLFGLSHGHAVAVCLPYVWRYMIENTNKCCDPRGVEHLNSVLNKLNELFFVDEPRQAVYRFFRILNLLELEFPKLNNPEELDVLVNSVNPTRLKNNPVELDNEAILTIYKNIFFDGNNYPTRNILKFLKKYHTLHEVKELQDYSLEILKELDSFCNKHNIEYFAIEGTLLGAVRHNGFIPWDDDVDVCMKREDYNRFIKLAKESFNKDYVLDCFETNKKHWTVCAKLQLVKETKFKIKRLQNIALSISPSIDIFPIDAVDDTESTKKAYSMVRFWKIMLWLKTGYTHDYGSIKYSILKFASLFLTTKFIHNRIKAIPKKVTVKNNTKYINFGSLYDYKKEIFNADAFSTATKIKFCNTEVSVPVGYREVLFTTYGDYEKLPPYSRRFPKHSYFVESNFKK